ncbi:MAG TPA: hypothetical protein VJN64_04220 [Terriglobales bacterium]|nr:hypothetical protein [Terriglobales bacterium]
MDFGNVKQDLVNKGVEKGKEELEKLKGRFTDQKTGEQSTGTQAENLASQSSGRSSSDQISAPSGTSEETDTDLADSRRQSEVDAVAETEPADEDVEGGSDENAA